MRISDGKAVFAKAVDAQVKVLDDLIAVIDEVRTLANRNRGTEALTLVSHGVSDELYAEVSAEFSEKELAYLSTAIAAINVWNRFGAPYRWAPPVRKQAPQAKAG